MSSILDEPLLCLKCKLRSNPDERPCDECWKRAGRKSIGIFALLLAHVAKAYDNVPAWVAELSDIETGDESPPLVGETFRFLEQARTLSNELAEFAGLDVTRIPADAVAPFIDRISKGESE